MRSNLFWLNDEQWEKIKPLLPMDVRGKERVDDRRVISGILHVLIAGGAIVHPSTVRRPRYTTALCAGRSAVCGRTSSGSSPRKDDRHKRR
jgi:Putative transposase of IS4/5 family (DUF4096)